MQKILLRPVLLVLFLTVIIGGKQCLGKEEGSSQKPTEANGSTSRALLGKYSEEQIIKVIYPNYDPRTKAIGIKSEEKEETYVFQYKAKEWTYSRDTIVAVLFLSPKQEDEEGFLSLEGDEEAYLDVVVLKEEGGSLSMVARNQDKLDYSGELTFDKQSITLDLAPYKLRDSEYGFGTRLSVNSVRLQFAEDFTDFKLYRVIGDKLAMVASLNTDSEVYPHMDCPCTSVKAIIVVSDTETKGFHNLVVKTYRKISDETGKRTRKLYKPKIEIYKWDGEKYVNTAPRR